MNYLTFKFCDNSCIITHIKEIYHKTSSGKSWKSKPDTTETTTATAEFYTNYVNSIPFFNGFMGGTCRAEKSYTPAGYIPVKITTISPDRTEKHCDHFYFKY
jgi:hypothetical protein